MNYQNAPFYKFLQSYQDQELPKKRTAHIGIGGSGLGPTLSTFLMCDTYKVFDHLNIDELKSFKPEQLVVVSKSGTTLESLFFLRQAIEEFPNLKENLILASDGDQGDLLEISKDLKCRHIQIPKDLGGRYSIFSSVGGIPLNIMGHSIKEFTNFNVEEASKLGTSIAQFALQSDRKNICVWSYHPKLDLLPEWFCQLWAESLGKNNHGIFPIPCKGPRDQHSVLQYFMQGSVSHSHLFIHAPIESKTSFKDPLWSKLSTLRNYSNKSLNDLNSALCQGTAMGLKENGNPVMTLEIKPTLSSLGSFLFSLMVATIKVANNWSINPFDQPGVERSKELAREVLKK